MNNFDQLVEYLKTALIFPKEIHLESSSRCNSHCLTCPRDKMQRELGEMDRDIFVKAVKETSEYDMDFLMMHLNGEPLMLDIDDLVWRINYARETNPKIKQIVMFTNGSLLTPERVDKLVGSKLDLIMLSVDGGNKEDYEKVRRGLSWDVLIANVKYLVKRKKELQSDLWIQSAIIPQKANQNSVDTYFKLFKELQINHVGGSGVNNIGGLIDAESMKLSATQHDDPRNANLPCFKLFLDLSIMSDGRACVCAQDVAGAQVLGDFKDNTLRELWNGGRMRDIREEFIYGHKCYVPFCDKCDYMTGFDLPEYWKVPEDIWMTAYEEATDRRP